eukprot:Clim_evm28s210 gene=Clim_evmTU28s210
MSKFRIAMIQLLVGANKTENVDRAVQMINKAAESGAKIIALPECFNSPYGTKHFPNYAESIPGPTIDSLKMAAEDTNTYIVAGSIPEVDGNKYYNTSVVLNPKGDIIAKHRKVHLFDIDVPGKITFKESDVLTGGTEPTIFDTEYCRIGLGICYDIRFPRLAQWMRTAGCKVILYPGAFNMTTGPAHWELLVRARANDCQSYVAAVSPARDESAEYVAWGHTTIASPWGDVVGKLDSAEDILYQDIDLDRVEEVRSSIPISTQERPEAYATPQPLS